MGTCPRGKFIQVDKSDCHVPAHCFPYHYVYYVMGQIYINQDAPANKLIYTSLGQSHSQAVNRSANKYIFRFFGEHADSLKHSQLAACLLYLQQRWIQSHS